MRAFFLLLLFAAPLAAQPYAAPDTLPVPPGTPDAWLLRPERTGWFETSRYDDVTAFLDAVVPSTPRLHRGVYGYSVEGRSLPLVVWGEVDDASAAGVRASGKVRVWVQANIHAGEVAGKEATLRLIRELAQGEHAGWADEVVLLIAPIHNADGNERVRLGNRPWQLGPLGGMGQRPNADGLDLNRDQVKLASPEARAFVQALADFDPHVVLDLHTTDGSFHGYHLTYAPGLHPGSPAAPTHLLRNRLLPDVTRALERDDALLVYHYGNFNGFQRLPNPADPVWNTFDWRPRFATNYAGLRGHLAILSEAYSYLSFAHRVHATERFVEAVVDWAAAHPAEVKSAVEQARALPERLALTARLAEGERRLILVGAADTLRHPSTGAELYRRAQAVTPVQMRDRTAFDADLVTTPPAAYLVADTLDAALERVQAHGLGVEPIGSGCRGRAEVFAVERVVQSERPFQGVREVRVEGEWSTSDVPPTGYRLVRVHDGPSARIAALLLEPLSADGLLNWGLIPTAEGAAFPVLRLVESDCL
jgi:hypothetical protein